MATRWGALLVPGVHRSPLECQPASAACPRRRPLHRRLLGGAQLRLRLGDLARMPARSVSRPVQTPFVALLIEVSWLLSVRDRLELLADRRRAPRAIGRRVDLDLALVERREGQQAGEADRPPPAKAGSGASGSTTQ